jgi:hypothetical protein
LLCWEVNFLLLLELQYSIWLLLAVLLAVLEAVVVVALAGIEQTILLVLEYQAQNYLAAAQQLKLLCH